MATETAELVGGPHDGAKLQVTRNAREALLWHRGGEVADVCGGAEVTVTTVVLDRASRHRYQRTDRRTRGGATVFAHAGNCVGLC